MVDPVSVLPSKEMSRRGKAFSTLFPFNFGNISGASLPSSDIAQLRTPAHHVRVICLQIEKIPLTHLVFHLNLAQWWTQIPVPSPLPHQLPPEEEIPPQLALLM